MKRYFRVAVIAFYEVLAAAILVLAAVSIFTGCAQVGAGDTTEHPVLTRTILDEDGEPVGTVAVSMAADLVSRGCIAIEISSEGDVSSILQQDGSGDWSTVRGLASIVPETVAVALNPISTPIAALVEVLTGRPMMQPPSAIHGCEGLFENNEGDEDDGP